MSLIEVIVTIFGAHEHLVSLSHKLIQVAIILEVKKVRPGVPTALLGNINRYNTILIGVESVNGLESRDDGDFMLHRATSEEYCYVSLHFQYFKCTEAKSHDTSKPVLVSDSKSPNDSICKFTKFLAKMQYDIMNN